MDKKMKKVYICGLAERNFKKVLPFNNPDCEIWGLGVHAIWMRKHKRFLPFNKLFEIHDYSEYVQDTFPFLVNYSNKVVLKDKNEYIPNYELYPFEEIYETYGTYFTNSLSYMLILAYHLGYRDIYLYGISFGDPDKATLRENIQEKANLYYWIGYLQGKGCKITDVSQKNKYFLKTKNIYSSVVLPKIARQRKKVNKEFQKLKNKKIDFSEYNEDCRSFLKELFKLGNE